MGFPFIEEYIRKWLYSFVLVGCVYLSKENIHTSKVMYMIRKGRPYIWVPEKDFHNVVCFFVFFTNLLLFSFPLSDIQNKEGK